MDFDLTCYSTITSLSISCCRGNSSIEVLTQTQDTSRMPRAWASASKSIDSALAPFALAPSAPPAVPEFEGHFPTRVDISWEVVVQVQERTLRRYSRTVTPRLHCIVFSADEKWPPQRVMPLRLESLLIRRLRSPSPHAFLLRKGAFSFAEPCTAQEV